MDNLVKPPIKWVGGKTQIINTLLLKFPHLIKNYYEPFLGGGSVLLGMLCLRKKGLIKVKGRIFASDVNVSIIYLYKHIQLDYEGVYLEVNKLVKKYKCGSSGDQEKYYYELREKFNGSDKKEMSSCALFLFLNKTCFRGLYREGPNGFNVPFGHYKNPEIVSLEHLREISELIQDVKFRVLDYKLAIGSVKKGDFVYIDPPYVPINSTSFTKYNKSDFSESDHVELFNFIKSLPSKFIMSNSDTDLAKNAFSEFEIITIECKRTINSKNSGAKCLEVIVKNY